MFERCVGIVSQCLLNYQQFMADTAHDMEEPDKTHLIVALDLLSGLTQALGPEIQPFFANARPSLIELMIACFGVSVSCLSLPEIILG